MQKVSLDTSKAVSLVPPGAGFTGPISILPILELVPQLEPFKVAAANVEAQAERAVIDSEAAWQKGSDFLTVCGDQWDQLEDLRKAMKGPIDDYAAFIQTIFKPIQKRFLDAKLLVSDRMHAFQKAEKARRDQQEADQRRANEKAAEELAAAAEARGDTQTANAILDVATMAPIARSAPRLGGTNSFGRSTNVVKRWTASVESPMEVLQAILQGKLPISLIEWKQAEINKVATTLKVEKTVLGLKVYQSETLQQR